MPEAFGPEDVPAQIPHVFTRPEPYGEDGAADGHQYREHNEFGSADALADSVKCPTVFRFAERLRRLAESHAI